VTGLDDASRQHRLAADADLESRLGLVATAFRLKDEERSGWVLRGVRAPESVADHSWGTALLCLLFADQAGVDRERAVAIALIHDLAEAVTGDVVARVAAADREVSEARKAAMETAAMGTLLRPGVAEFESVLHLWEAYEERADDAARFVRDMNLIDMCLQAARYDATAVVPSQGGYEHLDEFFVSAEQRLESALAKEMFELVKTDYLSSR